MCLAVDVDLEALRRRYGSRQVRESGGVISINGAIPASSLRSHYGLGIPESAEEIARWINAVLGVKAHKGVSARHEGVLRLARWIDNRLATQPHARVGEKELLARAAQWIPDRFAGVEIDFEHLRIWPKVAREAEALQAGLTSAAPVDHREEEAIACLESDKPQRQERGLQLLADLADPDLFEWCVLLLGEDHPQSAVGVLKVMRRCEDIQPEVLAPYAASEHKAVRLLRCWSCAAERRPEVVLARPDRPGAARAAERGQVPRPPWTRARIATALRLRSTTRIRRWRKRRAS